MHLTRRIRIQLAIFAVVGVVAATWVLLGYIRLPVLMAGVGRYNVTVELPSASGLYRTGNVTYRGVEVGRVDRVQLTSTGVQAVLSLKSGINIPSDLDAQVHSVSAIGEQYVALLPRSGTSRPLRDGDVIPLSRTSVPPDINALLDATNRGLQAIPQDNLKTAIDESYTAIGGLGPEMSRIVRGSTALAIDGRKNLDPLLTLIDGSKPILDTQTDTANSVRGWADHLAAITKSLQRHDASVQGFFEKSGPAADEARQLFDRLKPTLPVLLANLVSLNQVLITYRPGVEQLLVLLPEATSAIQAVNLANRDTKQPYAGAFLDFQLNLNVPPPCTTGFLPATQMRPPADEDYPDRPAGNIYCRLPQDSDLNVRGARNTPCVTVPGKRAPTVAMCESKEQYVPLNDGYIWKGDPNATTSGQAVPQPPPGTPGSTGPPVTQPPLSPLVAAAKYDPATGTYVGPDGQLYTESSLAAGADGPRSWQTMLLPPKGP
jgi:phospholipid/cholesterol/gamma-HCH transport system substrate-binding protein